MSRHVVHYRGQHRYCVAAARRAWDLRFLRMDVGGHACWRMTSHAMRQFSMTFDPLMNLISPLLCGRGSLCGYRENVHRVDGHADDGRDGLPVLELGVLGELLDGKWDAHGQYTTVASGFASCSNLRSCNATCVSMCAESVSTHNSCASRSIICTA